MFFAFDSIHSIYKFLNVLLSFGLNRLLLYFFAAHSTFGEVLPR
jgi:hypothetical protein